MNEAAQPMRPIAPLWHTLFILLLILGTSLAGGITHHFTGAKSPHIPSLHRAHLVIYSATLIWEWILLALTLWGARRRGTSLRQLLGERRAGAMEALTDFAIGIGFWFGSSIVLAGVALLLRFAHLSAGGITRAVARLGPASPAELVLWLCLSITAGICEELIFRGYLQQQFTAITHRIWLGIAISAVFFGFAHGYEGLAGMVLITLYGALFGMLAKFRGSLRAGMFAHAWHDSFSGFFLYFGAHLLSRIPH